MLKETRNGRIIVTSVPDSSLEIGLAALKQGDYPTAIAHLENVCQAQLNQTAQVKAQMGLVVAYVHTGKISRALVLCQTLSKNTNPQVREWAVRNQAELNNRYTAEKTASSTPTESDVTGFVAFERPVKRTGGEEQSEPPPASPAPESSPLFQWRQAGRAKRWQPLSAVNLIPLWLLQAGTAIALFWLIREFLKFAMTFTNDLLVKLPYLEPFQPFYRDPTPLVLLTLLLLMSLSPWLLDGLLRLFYGFQPLSTKTLSTHSPEAIRVLQRYCRQRHWPLPQLGILPTSAPVAITYGNLPRTARIVVSQGLLEQLADDEIATIYASQLGHIAHRDFVVMSLIILVTQISYTIYRQLSQWGDQIEGKRKKHSLYFFLAGVLATFAYGVWYLLNGSALWLSQLRIYYSDRFAAEVTGNPNGLTRALLKIAIGIAEDIKQQGHTSWLLESLNLLTLVGYRQAITLGSLHPFAQFEPVLTWDCLNPYRYWLIINNSHPLMGDRLQRLSRIAHDWHLETELNLPSTQSSANFRFNLKSIIQNQKSLLLQGAPFFGIFLGFAFGVLTWLVGGVGILLGIAQLAWMYGDWAIIKGCLPIGFSIGTFVRINSFFPDTKTSTVQTTKRVLGRQSHTTPVLRTAQRNSTAWLLNSLSNLPHLLANDTALPIDSHPVHLQGKLLGRRGISNLVGQDLILHSPNGLVKLHCVSWLGPVGNLVLRQSLSPTDLMDQYLVATGWFRRGATPWVDINTLRTQEAVGGKTSSSGHPVWSTLLASAAAAWGAYIIL